mgnify:CR=1
MLQGRIENRPIKVLCSSFILKTRSREFRGSWQDHLKVRTAVQPAGAVAELSSMSVESRRNFYAKQALDDWDKIFPLPLAKVAHF